MYRNQTVLRSSAVRQVAALSTAGVKVIAARYRTGVAGSTSFAYYYWFKEVPAALTPEFLGTLPPTHPLFWIREPSDYAPERQPQDDNPSSLVKFAASSQGLRP